MLSSSSSSQRRPPLPFHLLELSLICAQDLHPATRRVRAYAVAWVHPDHKLRTRSDRSGHTNPLWNERFVFCLDSSFLQSPTSALSVEIYAARPRPLRDRLLGSACLVISALRPSTTGASLSAFLVRRPSSLRPQGILNVGAAILDAQVPSTPLLAADLDGAERHAFGGDGVRRAPSRKMDDLEVETKLERWKTEMSPAQTGGWSPKGDRRKEGKRRGGLFSSCFRYRRSGKKGRGDFVVA